MLTAVALLSLAYSGWMLFTLYQSVREDEPSDWRDHLSLVWIGSGSTAGVILALLTLMRGWF